MLVHAGSKILMVKLCASVTDVSWFCDYSHVNQVSIAILLSCNSHLRLWKMQSHFHSWMLSFFPPLFSRSSIPSHWWLSEHFPNNNYISWELSSAFVAPGQALNTNSSFRMMVFPSAPRAHCRIWRRIACANKYVPNTNVRFELSLILRLKWSRLLKHKGQNRGLCVHIYRLLSLLLFTQGGKIQHLA